MQDEGLLLEKKTQAVNKKKTEEEEKVKAGQILRQQALETLKRKHNEGTGNRNYYDLTLFNQIYTHGTLGSMQ